MHQWCHSRGEQWKFPHEREALNFELKIKVKKCVCLNWKFEKVSGKSLLMKSIMCMRFMSFSSQLCRHLWLIKGHFHVDCELVMTVQCKIFFLFLAVPQPLTTIISHEHSQQMHPTSIHHWSKMMATIKSWNSDSTCHNTRPRKLS